MPIIDITLLQGRSYAAKRCLMEKITDAVVEAIDAPRDSVRIIIREVPPELFAVGGVPKKTPPGPE